jgi:hypothetical protein
MRMLVTRDRKPSLSVVTKAVGQVLQQASILGVLHGHPQGQFLVGGVAGFVQRNEVQHNAAINKWGMQLNTCVHVVADRI